MTAQAGATRVGGAICGDPRLRSDVTSACASAWRRASADAQSCPPIRNVHLMRRMLPRARSGDPCDAARRHPTRRLGGAAPAPCRGGGDPGGFRRPFGRLLPSVVNVASTQSSSGSDSGGQDGGSAGPSQDQPLEQGRDQQGVDPLRRHQADATTSGPSSSSAATQSPLDKRFQDFAAGPPSDSRPTRRVASSCRALAQASSSIPQV